MSKPRTKTRKATTHDEIMRVRSPKEIAAWQRGVEAAAGVAEMYDRGSSHPFLPSDCIRCKLNNPGAPKKPRKNPDALGEWTRGFALALAEVNRALDQPSIIVGVMRDAGVTIAELRRLRLDDYDLKELAKCVAGEPPHRRPMKGRRR